MRRSDLQEKQIKRILVFWEALFNDHQLQGETVLAFLGEHFALSENYLWFRIIQKHELKDFAHIRLIYADIDQKTITAFVEKLNRAAKQDRKEQLKLEL